MTEHSLEEKPVMPTIWRVPDELWEKIEPILKESTIHRRVPAGLGSTNGPSWTRSSFVCTPAAGGTVFPGEFPDDSTVHRAFQRWSELGVLDRIWAAPIEECEELGGVN